SSESVQLSFAANRTQNSWRAVGGKLFITNQRILFVPNHWDGKLGGKPVEFGHDQVLEIFVKENRTSLRELFSGGLRNRLGFRLSDSSIQYFVVNDLAKTKSKITEVLSISKQGFHRN